APEKEPWFRIFGASTPEVRVARAVRRLSGRVKAEPVRKTTLIAVTYLSSDPVQAAKVLQCLASAYLERHLQLRRPSGELTFFEHQMKQSAGTLEQAELQLMAFTDS